MRPDEFQNASPRRPRPGQQVSPKRVAASLNTREMSGSFSREEYGAGAYSLPRQMASASRSMVIPMSTSMGSSTTAASTTKTIPNLMHTKLHKRAGSGSSATVNTFPPAGLSTSFTDDDLPPIINPTPNSPVAKVKPYLRKLSSAKEDQGRIDLSRSVAENEAFTGLGIQELPRSASDVVFAPNSRHHTRNTSVGSQMSTGSGSYRPTQAFVHPMRQAPRPYTPPTHRSFESSPHDDEEEDTIVDGEPRINPSFRGRRSMSNSSTPAQLGAPTPLSQTITASDLGSIPRLSNTSQSNLSIISTNPSKPSGSRRNTGRSQDLTTSPSSRTSFDKTFSYGSRRSDTEASTRDERIRAARKKFEEREASKDRKAEKEASRRQEAEEIKQQRRQNRERKQSDASEKGRPTRPGLSARGGSSRTGSALGMVSNANYEERPSIASLPQGTAMVEMSEKSPASHVERGDKAAKAGFFARMFSCGKSR